ncbi:MAG: DUF2341 domain-containing protein, partial [Patescibacteria group bacterium]
MNLKKENLRQVLFYFYRSSLILLSKLSKEFRFFYLIYIKRDKSCRKIYSGWYVITIKDEKSKCKINSVNKLFSNIKKNKLTENYSEIKKEKTNPIREEISIGINWKEKYFDLKIQFINLQKQFANLKKQFFILEKKFRQQYFKFGTTRAVAVFLCIALIITAGWQMIWNMSRAAAAATWGFTSAGDYTAAANVEVDAADNNLARLKSNYTLGTDWIATNGNGYDWKYRQEISVDNSQAEYDFSNYQLRVALTSANFDFSIPDSQGNDIRFTGALARTNYASETARLNAQGSNEVSYYKESYDQSAKTAVFWVKLPNIYSFWGVSTENSGTDNKVKVDDVSGFPDPADFPNGEMPVTVKDTSNSETNYITAINADTKELTFKNNFAVSYLTSKTAQVKYIEDEQVYLYYGNSNATVSTQVTIGSMFGEANLQGLWKLDENTGTAATDYSGNSNVGAITSATWSTSGKFGNTLSFDGSNDLVHIHNVSGGLNLGTSPATYSAWIYQTGGNNNYVIGAGNGDNIAMQIYTGQVWCYFGESSSHGYIGSNAAQISAGNWYNVVCTRDGSGFGMYVNGASVPFTAYGPSTVDMSAAFVNIGVGRESGWWWQGLIDDVAIYNRAFSTDEVLAQYNLRLLISTIQPSQSLYPSIWQYQRAITIDNSSGGALTDFQIKISLAAGNFNFSHANSNGSDIRFTDSDTTTELDYWIESYNSADQAATIWVKVPSISASSTKTIYMYHGNAGAGNVASGTDTFVLFDNFDDGQLSSIWTFANNGNSANTYYETTNPGKMILTTASSDMYGGTYSFSQLRLTTIPEGDFEAIVEMNAAGVANYEIWGIGGSTDGNNFFRVGKGYHSGFGNKTIHFGKMLSGSPAEAGVSHSADFAYLKIRRVGTTYTSYWTDDLSSWTQIGTSQSFTPATFGLFGIKTTAVSMSQTFDNFRIRKYASTEPTTTVNSETNVAWPSSEVAKLTVVNNTGQNYASLSSFTQTLGSGNAGSVKYQISNNGTNWYWYNSGTGDWEAASSLLQTNTASDVN